MLAIGSVFSYWPVPWGSYNVDWQVPVAMWGGIATSLATLVVVIGINFSDIGTLRAHIWPSWTAELLIIGPLTVVPRLHVTVYAGLFGLAWLLAGYALLSRREESVGRAAQAMRVTE